MNSLTEEREFVFGESPVIKYESDAVLKSRRLSGQTSNHQSISKIVSTNDKGRNASFSA